MSGLLIEIVSIEDNCLWVGADEVAEGEAMVLKLSVHWTRVHTGCLLERESLGLGGDTIAGKFVRGPHVVDLGWGDGSVVSHGGSSNSGAANGELENLVLLGGEVHDLIAGVCSLGNLNLRLNLFFTDLELDAVGNLFHHY